ncbi:MAG TPA: flavin reductase family protein [Actinocrinis sp.]|nr:flavin reductase family protein [Actinocrinis sp.]
MSGTSAAGPFRDRDELRAVFGRFATGVTILTAGRTHPHGMTANSFTSVSLTPPLVLVCVRREAAMHDVILDHGAYAVSVLSARQGHVARHFANRARPRGALEFATAESTPGRRTGAPIMAGALAWFECRLAAVYDGGDHSIFLGEVLDLGRVPDADDALLFYGGGFHGLAPESVHHRR